MADMGAPWKWVTELNLQEMKSPCLSSLSLLWWLFSYLPTVSLTLYLSLAGGTGCQAW